MKRGEEPGGGTGGEEPGTDESVPILGHHDALE